MDFSTQPLTETHAGRRWRRAGSARRRRSKLRHQPDTRARRASSARPGARRCPPPPAGGSTSTRDASAANSGLSLAAADRLVTASADGVARSECDPTPPGPRQPTASLQSARGVQRHSDVPPVHPTHQGGPLRSRASCLLRSSC
ncbi:hypothetical protein PVAP13_7NG264648 [Panicum virgatum]|uniref:Uncharacterized protein n=1 Tax=Panicum virgatum TaxID=38727 RepID=A0A8T0Q1G4_PANVG|nr:hypothetical protein PVAP13_7NG264648 [Panicum virgatum]